MRRSVYEQLDLEIIEAQRAAVAAEQKARELARMRDEHAALRVAHALIRLQRVLAKEYNPNQPRVPTGQPGAGRWTSDNADAVGGHDPTLTERVIEAARQGRTLTDEECWEQYERDLFHCRMVGLKSCYAQAAERFSACLAGRPIPPLNY